MLNFSTHKRTESPIMGGSSSCPAPLPITARRVGLLSLFMALFVLAAGFVFAGASYAGGSSCPSIHNLQPANGCSTYSVSFGTDKQGHCTATFTCWNTNQSNGDCVTGFVCYWVGPGDCKPLCQSAPSNCQTTCWGQYCNCVWDYNCYPACNNGGTSCGSGGTGGTSCGGNSGGGGTSCGGNSGGGNGGGGYCQDQGCTSGGTGGTGGTNCGGNGGGGNGCWYNQCGWLPQGCLTPGNCNQPTCFTLTYPCGTKLCASDFCCAVHCYQQTGCDYWCMCGSQNLGKLSVSASPTSVCITNKESTQLSYTITNSGTGNVNNVAVTDNFGTLSLASVLPSDTLTPGQSVTVTRTISNQNASFTDDISATGIDTNNSQVNAGTTVSVDVVHPSLSLTASAGQMTGNTVPITYVLTNTGDDTINGITVTGYVNGSPTTLASGLSLAPNGTQTITQNVTVNGTTEVYAVASGTDSCSSVPVSVTSTTIQPPATITGTVSCATCTCPITGATVELLNSSNTVVASMATGATGAFEFDNIPTGSYTISVVDSPNYETYTGPSFAFNSTGNDYSAGLIGLTAAPVSYNAAPGAVIGNVDFASEAFFSAYSFITISNQPVTQAGLYTSTYVSGSGGSYVAYPYTGTIPEFPELGSFNGNVYVVVLQPLLPANTYNGQSFIDQIGVYSDSLGSYLGSEGVSGDYTFRMLFDQQFTGPGTAYSYAFTPLTFGSTVSTPNSITALPAIWTGTGTPPATPPAGTYPAGWMAQGQAQYILPPLTTVNLYVNGGYDDICGDQFTFSICPTVGGPL